MEDLTLTDLFERLRSWEETFLLEKLGITSSDLVDRFSDIIEEKFDELCGEIEELEQFDEDETEEERAERVR